MLPMFITLATLAVAFWLVREIHREWAMFLERREWAIRDKVRNEESLEKTISMSHFEDVERSFAAKIDDLESDIANMKLDAFYSKKK